MPRRPPRPSKSRAHRRLVIAIDGPAGSGKTTVARAVAASLGYRRLDTGAMYRAVTLAALREGIDPADARALAAMARRLRFDLRDSEVLVDGRPAGKAIRTRAVSARVSQVAAHPAIRRVLVRRQRELIGKGGVVAEGRDIGTVVCPGADLKVFLTASAGERARRRHRELGTSVTYETLKREIRRRDATDSTRATSPLRPARDAVVIDSTGRSAKTVVAEIVGLARGLGARGETRRAAQPTSRRAAKRPKSGSVREGARKTAKVRGGGGG